MATTIPSIGQLTTTTTGQGPAPIPPPLTSSSTTTAPNTPTPMITSQPGVIVPTTPIGTPPQHSPQFFHHSIHHGANHPPPQQQHHPFHPHPSIPQPHIHQNMPPQPGQGPPHAHANPADPNQQQHLPPLPPYLVNLGWRLHWSKREVRYYYFNANTNESLWEMPRLGNPPAQQQHPHPHPNMYSDPLGIQQIHNHHHPHAHPIPPLKRPSTEALQPLHSPKRGNFLPPPVPPPGPWDLEIPPTLVITITPKISSLSPFNLLPTHPQLEVLRAGMCNKLRATFLSTCKSREGIEVEYPTPTGQSEGDSSSGNCCGFDGWLLTQKYVDPHYLNPTTPPNNPEHFPPPVQTLLPIDPLLPSPNAYSATDSQPIEYPVELFESILTEIPVRLTGPKPRFTGDARKLLWKFAEGCGKIIEMRASAVLPPTTIKHVKWTISSTFTFLNSTNPQTPYDIFIERIEHLRTQILPHVHKAAEAGVIGICKKVSGIGKNYVESEIWEKGVKSVIQGGENDPQQQQQQTHHENSGAVIVTVGQPTVWLPTVYYPLCPNQVPTIASPLVEYLQPNKDTVLIKYKNETVKIGLTMLQKLDTLYKQCILTTSPSTHTSPITPHDDPSSTLFLLRVYNLLKRYAVFMNSSTLPFMTLPPAVAEFMSKNYRVQMSVWDNPFTTYYKTYCGTYPDVECWFNASGRFLNLEVLSGVFNVTPAWVPGIIRRVTSRCLELLEKSEHGNRDPHSESSPSDPEYLRQNSSQNHRHQHQGGELTFIITVPDPCPNYPNSSIDYLTEIRNNRFNLTPGEPYLKLLKFEHEWKSVKITGSSNVLSNWRSSVDTWVFVLRNNNSFNQHDHHNNHSGNFGDNTMSSSSSHSMNSHNNHTNVNVSDREYYQSKLKGFAESWKIGRERERDRVGGLSTERARVGTGIGIGPF